MVGPEQRGGDKPLSHGRWLCKEILVSPKYHHIVKKGVLPQIKIDVRVASLRLYLSKLNQWVGFASCKHDQKCTYWDSWSVLLASHDLSKLYSTAHHCLESRDDGHLWVQCLLWCADEAFWRKAKWSSRDTLNCLFYLICPSEHLKALVHWKTRWKSYMQRHPFNPLYILSGIHQNRLVERPFAYRKPSATTLMEQSWVL